MISLPQSKKPPAFSVSKWLKQQVLLDQEEMRLCLEWIAPLHIYAVGSILPLESLEVQKQEFLEEYALYISHLQDGVFMDPSRRVISSVLTRDRGAIYPEEIRPNGWMAKLAAPLIQLQHHKFFPSKVDHKIHPMVMSLDAVSWGLQFGFPQIFFDPVQGTYQKTWGDKTFSNAAVFSELLKWLRNHSVPTTFLWEGVKINTPIRLGKNCFKWIEAHPQLKNHGITVRQYSASS
ncbi:hypothetical protein [Rhabdochlamydiaceae symbiont of Dictyostelium giganteum]|uniref:hypothetical protein n=1 Tax=Rhabdochlamydiaceae symbiont of Dictyostelium giganteum TaxID=3342349 RepID=UPI00384B4B36